MGGISTSSDIFQLVPSGAYDAANRQLTFGGQTLTYDANGDLTSDGTNTYTWDARDRLTALAASGLTASFQYDPLGRRSSKTMNGAGAGFLYDGLNPVQELSGTTPIANLLTGLGIDEYFTRTTTGASHFLTDALGSTPALTDPTGAVSTTYTYEPFGATTVSGAASDNSLAYTGRENDGTGLYYYRARYYHPTLQRFISEDPIDIKGGPNLYSYVDGSPMEFRDPLGLYSLMELAGICYNESAGLRAIDEESSPNLGDARAAMIHVAENRWAAKDMSPIAPTALPSREAIAIRGGNRAAGAAWAECLTKAALVLAGRKRHEGDPTGGALHFIKDYGQKKPSWAQGPPRLEFGPFYNSAPGHVPTGALVPIQIYP